MSRALLESWEQGTSLITIALRNQKNCPVEIREIKRAEEPMTANLAWYILSLIILDEVKLISYKI